MAEENNDHPSRDQLVAFTSGRLDPAEQERIEQHVSNCDQCLEVMRDEPEDTLVERLREADTSFTSFHSERRSKPQAATGEIPEPLRDHARYRIVGRLGGGGMGVVYRAEHRLMDRPVALKVINPELMDHSEAVVRFRTEVRAAARLDHPNIVRAYDAEQADDLHFLVMEYVDGISLAELIRKKGPMSISQACIIARKIAFGLQHACRLGMVHRDIKPQNVMVTRAGQIKILDFGLARLARNSDRIEDVSGEVDGSRTQSALTQLGSMLGTPDYMAPEQADDSHTVDLRADLYSLGCTLYCLLAGRPPFPDGSMLEKLIAHREQEPTPLSKLRDDAPLELVNVVDKMMAKEPGERYQSPGEVAEALLPFSRTPASTAPRAPQPVALADVIADLEDRQGREPSPTEIDFLPPVGRRTRSGNRSRRTPGYRRAGAIACGIALGLVLLIWLSMNGFFGGDSSTPGAGNDSLAANVKSENGEKADEGSAAKQSPIRILIVLPHDGFWNPDFAPVHRVLKEGGARVHVASSARTAALPYPQEGDERPVTPDLLISEAKVADYDAVVFTGQCIRATTKNEFLGRSPVAREAKRFMRAMLAQDKFVTSVCGGTDVLADAGVLLGRAAAHHQYIDPEIVEKSGAKWDYDQRIVISNRIITAKTWDDAETLARTLLRVLQTKR